MFRKVIVLAIVVALCSAVTPALAGGPADLITCIGTKLGNATKLHGTVAVGVQNAGTQGITDVDFTLRLQRGNQAPIFFRASVPMQVFATSNEGILCNLLSDSTSPAAVALRAAILSAFGLSSNAKFFLKEGSVRDAEIQGETGQWFCNDTFTDPSQLQGPCDAQRAGSMADVNLFVR